MFALNGTISSPDTIMTLGLSETSNLPLSTPFTISWAGSNADFYYVSFNYEYKDENDNSQWDSFEEMTINNSYTFPDSIFVSVLSMLINFALITSIFLNALLLPSSLSMEIVPKSKSGENKLSCVHLPSNLT